MVARRKPPARVARAQRDALVRVDGLVLTVQRRAILETILPRTEHPTADRVFALVRASHPEIGRATVYRTLEKLNALGIIRKVCHPGAAVRYDPCTERHHHLVCRRCGAMVDVEVPEMHAIALPAKLAQGFDIEDYSIQFRGVCKGCRRRRRRERPVRNGRKA